MTVFPQRRGNKATRAHSSGVNGAVHDFDMGCGRRKDIIVIITRKHFMEWVNGRNEVESCGDTDAMGYIG